MYAPSRSTRPSLCAALPFLPLSLSPFPFSRVRTLSRDRERQLRKVQRALPPPKRCARHVELPVARQLLLVNIPSSNSSHRHNSPPVSAVMCTSAHTVSNAPRSRSVLINRRVHQVYSQSIPRRRLCRVPFYRAAKRTGKGTSHMSLHFSLLPLLLLPSQSRLGFDNW